MTRRRLYGWFDQRTHTFRLSAYPADAPVRPSIEFQTKDELMDVVERKHAEVLWWPPLPDCMMVNRGIQS